MAGMRASEKTPDRKPGFLASVLTLLSGRGIEAIVGITFMPIITRLFSPKDYGLAVTLIAITTLLMPVATLTYERAIVLTSSMEEEVGLSVLSLIGSICLASILLVAYSMGVFNWYIEMNQALSAWLWVIPFYIVTRALMLVVEQIAIKHTAYRRLAAAGAADISTAVALRIAGGYTFGSSVLVLVVAFSFGILLRIWFSSRSIINLPAWSGSLGRVKNLWLIAKSRSEFPRYQVWGSSFRSLGNNLPVIVFASMYTPAAAGVYALAIALSRRPLEMVLNSYRAVFLQRGAGIQCDSKKLLAFFRKHTLLTFGIAIVPFMALFSLSPVIFPIILGDDWRQVGEFIQIISLWLLSLFIALPSTAIFILTRRQQLWFRISIVSTALQLSPLLAAEFYQLGIQQVLWLYSGIGAITNVVMIIIANQSITLKTEQV